MGRSRRARPLAKRSAPAHFEPAAYALQGPVSPRGLAGQGTAMCHWFPHVDRLHVCYRRIHVIATHSGEGPFIVRFADLCLATAFDFRLRLAATEYSADLALA